MEKFSKEKLLSEVKFLQNKLRDVVTAYKSLQKEKEALEIGLKAFKNVSEGEQPQTSKSASENENQTEDDSSSKGDDQKYSPEVNMLMNSLTSLSVEKSRMEANFQADKKKLRQEKEMLEISIRDLQDKIKTLNLDHTKEIEQLKTNLIIERHEREKEQNEYQIQLRELQDFLKQERESKVLIEKNLSEISLRDEVERSKEVQRSEKLISLQQAHMNAIEKEKQKFQKEAQRAYEQRIASLESKLADLSSTLAKYNRSRQEDQNEIFKLREKITELSNIQATSKACTLEDAQCQTSFQENDIIEPTSNKLKEIQTLYYEDNMKCYLEKEDIPTTSKEKTEKDSNTNILENELKNLQIKLQMLVDQNNLLNDQYNDTVQRYEKQMDDLRKTQSILTTNYEKDLKDIHMQHRAQIHELESQVQKQRERTIALLEEKEQEVNTLKTSFQLFVPGNKHAVLPEFTGESVPMSQLDEVLDGTSKLNPQENPHILYYAHELARRDVVITNLRKSCYQLENSLREIKKEFMLMKQSNQDQIKILNNQISRFERCQSREGANLEYLKNVIVNYLHSKNSSSKRHMLNAIAVILKLTDSEINKIKNAL